MNITTVQIYTYERSNCLNRLTIFVLHIFIYTDYSSTDKWQTAREDSIGTANTNAVQFPHLVCLSLMALLTSTNAVHVSLSLPPPLSLALHHHGRVVERENREHRTDKYDNSGDTEANLVHYLVVVVKSEE